MPYQNVNFQIPISSPLNIQKQVQPNTYNSCAKVHQQVRNRPFSISVKAVEIIPSLSFRSAEYLITVKRSIQCDREHSDKRHLQAYTGSFKHTQRNNRHKRSQQMHEKIRSLKHMLIPIRRPEKQQNCQHRYSHSSSPNDFQIICPLRVRKQQH